MYFGLLTQIDFETNQMARRAQRGWQHVVVGRQSVVQILCAQVTLRQPPENEDLRTVFSPLSTKEVQQLLWGVSWEQNVPVGGHQRASSRVDTEVSMPAAKGKSMKSQKNGYGVVITCIRKDLGDLDLVCKHIHELKSDFEVSTRQFLFKLSCRLVKPTAPTGPNARSEAKHLTLHAAPRFTPRGAKLPWNGDRRFV